MNLQYIGARYVPVWYHNSQDDSANWEVNVEYEPLTWVTTPNNHLYLSKKTVPDNIGTPAQNTAYWLDMGLITGNTQHIQDEIDAIVANIGDLNDLATTDKSSLVNAINEIAGGSSPVSVGFVTPEEFGAAGDGVTDDTAAINDMLANANGRIVLFKNTYLINGAVNTKLTEGGLQVKSNTIIRFASGAKLVEASNDTYNSHIFNILNVENVDIGYGTIIGDYDTHSHVSGYTDEWCHGIRVTASKNIKIHDMTIKNCYGDGVYIGQAWASQVDTLPDDNHCRNVILENIIIEKCGRNGISVGDCIEWKLSNIHIDNVNRTNPKAGIDVEQEGDYSPNVSVGLIENVYTQNCGNWGVVITDCTHNQKLSNITGDKLNLNMNSGGIMYVDKSNVQIQITGTKAFISNTTSSACSMLGGYSVVTFENCDILWDGTVEIPVVMNNCRILNSKVYTKNAEFHSCTFTHNDTVGYCVRAELNLYMDNCIFELVTQPDWAIVNASNGHGRFQIQGCKCIGLTTAINHPFVNTATAALVNGNNYHPFNGPGSVVTGCLNFSYNP